MQYLLQVQERSGRSQMPHMNSLAIAGDYRDLGIPATGRWSMALRWMANLFSDRVDRRLTIVRLH
jgi:hypothetical protein